MKKIFITCATILALLSSCSSILDKEDLSSISEEQVWEDETLTTAFLNALYISIPSWDPALADASDEATGGGGWTNGTTTRFYYLDLGNSYFRGIISSRMAAL